jgi:hypothetical protein
LDKPAAGVIGIVLKVGRQRDGCRVVEPVAEFLLSDTELGELILLSGFDDVARRQQHHQKHTQLFDKHLRLPTHI